jgi:hypothetical protein
MLYSALVSVELLHDFGFSASSKTSARLFKKLALFPLSLSCFLGSLCLQRLICNRLIRFVIWWHLVFLVPKLAPGMASDGWDGCRSKSRMMDD